MLKLFKYLKKKDWILFSISIVLIVMQVALELKIPDYTNSLTIIV